VEPVSAPVSGSKKLEFAYDYMNRRVRKQVFVRTAGTWPTTPETDTRFVYDGWNVILELDGLNTGGTGVPPVIRKYTWGLDLSGSLQGAGGIGGLLAMQSVSGELAGNYAYFYDANGNVGQLVNLASGAVAARYEYDPYGNTTNALALSAVNPFCFSTKYRDRELDGASTAEDLYYYGERYYLPRLGRWASRDPAETDREEIILYCFVANQPSSYVDPDGRIPWPPMPPPLPTPSSDCGIEIHQSPFCVFGDPGHTWLTWGNGKKGKTADCPNDYIHRRDHKCEKDYINNKWRTRTVKYSLMYPNWTACSSATCDDIKKCLRRYAKDRNDDFCYEGPFCKNNYHCRIFTRDALSNCCLERSTLIYVDLFAPLRYCCSACSRGEDVREEDSD
jgi:RHS repeat-associated protein